MNKIGLVLVDDHHILLDGLSALLKRQKDMEVKGTFTNGHEAIHALDTLKPDVVLVDINMPEMTGVELTQKIRKHNPGVAVICLSMHDGIDYILEMVDAGVSGYLLKNTNDKELLEAIRTVHDGKLYFPPDISAKITTEAIRKRKSEEQEKEMHLTDRELEILKLVFKEYSNAKIAEELFISERTVETHRKNMLRKTKSNSMLGLMKYAMEHKLV